MTECNKCLYGDDMRVVMDADGICDYCAMTNRLENDYPVSKKLLRAMFKKIKSRSTGKYDCLFGISGGCDSSYLLHLIMKHGLNPLVYHWDNGWNTDIANENMSIMQDKLCFDFIRVHATDEYHELNKAFLEASVNDADLPNDIAMMRIAMDLAKSFGIKYILNGHNFRTESSCPVYWSFIDSNYVEAIFKAHTGKKLRTFPLYPYTYQFKNLFGGIRQPRPLYHCGETKSEMKDVLIKEYGWKDYGGHHHENIYTAFIGAYLLPKKFGVDKRRLGLSALIRFGRITKSEAKKILGTEQEYPDEYLDMVVERYMGGDRSQLERILGMPTKHFYDYVTPTRFTTLKPLFWFATKLGFFPYTFYKKYTTEVRAILRDR